MAQDVPFIQSHRGDETSQETGTGDLLAGLVHELRTPLAAIGGYAELLGHGVHGPITAAQADGLVRIRRNQELMLEQLRNVAEYAEAIAGSAQLDVQPACLASLAERAVADCAVLLAPFVCVVDESGSLGARPVETDAEIVVGILTHLLHDAIDHAIDHAVGHPVMSRVVRVRVFSSDDRATVEIETDTHPISHEDELSIFLPFHRGSRNVRRKSASHSLALPLARTLARSLRGEVVAVPHAHVRRLRLELPLTPPVSPERLV